MAINNNSLKRRLLQDISEIQENPYPGIALHIEDDLTRACLVLSPEDEPPLHLTIDFPIEYPLEPPVIHIQSSVNHPNVFDDYICINLLNDPNAYTPAYSLKGICIQMLSFFSSDKVEQMYGEHGGVVDRKQWQEGDHADDIFGRSFEEKEYKCSKCAFGQSTVRTPEYMPTVNDMPAAAIDDGAVATTDDASGVANTDGTTSESGDKKKNDPTRLVDLPQEVILLFCDYLDEKSLLLAARAWNGFGRVMRTYNIMRTRELQCFTFKRGFKELDLGVGVDVTHSREQGRSITSEFDLLSRMAYEQCQVRQSIQGIPFTYWLPLPISHQHWTRVRKEVDSRLEAIQRTAGIQGTLDNVIYTFLNDIVVRLSRDAEDVTSPYLAMLGIERPKSTLTHASEKAIESYFHLLHLLVCLATERNIWSKRANDAIKDFMGGHRDKKDCPNIGWLLIQILISDANDDHVALTKAIIQEAITRNVVWMLEPGPKGKGMCELSFMETSPFSEYRLAKTFEAGKTSYRLMMFLNVMRKVVHSVRHFKDADGNQKHLTLNEFRDELFRRHGAPPNGAAAVLAERVKEIQKVNSFPQFLENMDVPMPNKSSFTSLLRSCVQSSMDKGYTKWTLTQPQALNFRIPKEPGVARPDGMVPAAWPGGQISFFPNRGGHNGGRGGRGDGRGGRGGGRGGRGPRGGRG